MANDLLAAALHQEREQIDEKLFFEVPGPQAGVALSAICFVTLKPFMPRVDVILFARHW